MPKEDVILRFNKVSYEYGHNMPILNEADFSVRRGAKIALMGQNGAGKSTIFNLIAEAAKGDKAKTKPEDGAINIEKGLSVATAKQVITRDELSLTIQNFLENTFTEKIYNIAARIDEALKIVNLKADHDRLLNTFSGGQQARLLLAKALIQKPDILLLDEPTNNLDKAGIEHLTKFLLDYPKTCIVISHDAEFLNQFTEGVLYLDVFTHIVEKYTGNYFDVVEEIKKRLERERMKNVRLEKDIQHRKEQAGFFAQKGGHMRDVARKMREKIEILEEDVVDIRQEDKTIRKFFIPTQEELSGEILTLSSVSVVKNHKATTKKVKLALKKNEHLLLSGPNGIGKTTLLERLATGHANGEHIPTNVRIGYYRQDFSTLDFDSTVYDAIKTTMLTGSEEQLRACAAGFLLDSKILRTKIGSLSEGQKGLVAFTQIVLLRPGLLILDEPTNHINFRHIPVIAQALTSFQGAMILVSHVPDFLSQIKIDQVLDLTDL
ncbi:MAG: hypothetical protein COU10_01105 [Candidatus Harrisonbacteria bacterium CG10_big_fil_rev_8_21_14_0_10_45_28]|uniref:ABC transporter domain-containing protein n=1 Tax=Candidatus Harrisonbacteria bacterium CG10_big_fil_rev_8_21_14_0_10_45_28 TaxID=1974586 RepID=A0A2H0UNS5_9BACT|nr:MAG: hypothetical protein COU10_01105 [Candidatus Harrisonbacteria bacterium CG10_big_fil_rev_8_21_14_0_10_45_28]